MGVPNPSRVSVGATRRMAASGQLGDGPDMVINVYAGIQEM
jgi:hypothetical protein